MRWAPYLLFVVGCGAGATGLAADDAITMRWTPEAGSVYAIVATVERAGEGMVGSRRTTIGTIEFVTVDDTGITLRERSERTSLDRPALPVRLPPRWIGRDCVMEMRVDRQGQLIGEATRTGACPEGRLWESSLMPDRPVRVGDHWLVHGGPDGDAELLAVHDGLATIALVGDASSPEGRVVTRGEIEVALRDGLPRVGWLRAVREGDRPTRVDVRFCAAGPGEPPCEPVADERPAVVSYVGAACSERLDAARAAAATRTLPIDVATLDLAHETRGVTPLEGPAPRIEASESGLRIEGRSVEVDEVADAIDAVRARWSASHDGASFSGRVRLHVASTTALSAIAPLLERILPTTGVELVVVRGTRERPAAPPAWLGDIPTDVGARAEAIGHALALATAGCEEIGGAFASVHELPRSERATATGPALLDAIGACGCGGVDLDAVDALLAWTFWIDGRELGALVIPAGTSGPVITLAPTDEASELVRRLAERATPGAAVRIRFR